MLTVLAVRAVAGHGESLCLIEPTRNVPSPHWNANLCYVRSVAGGELCRESNPRVTFHRPAGTLRARSFGSQGGGLYIVGTATLTNTNVYENEATGSVCSLFLTFCIARTFLPSPRWNADRCYVHCLAGCELSRKSNPCVTFHRPTGMLTVGGVLWQSGVSSGAKSNSRM